MDLDTLEQVILLVQKYELTELSYESDTASYVIKKAPPAVLSSPTMLSAVGPAAGPEQSPLPLKNASDHAATQSDRSPLTPVKASLVGTFYRATDPNSPPLSSLGQMVTKGDSLGLIEAMKVLVLVAAPCDGKIEKICVENGTIVEYDQTIFMIAPTS